MRPIEQKILASLAEQDEPTPWTHVFNGMCPWPALELFDAAIGLRHTGLIEVSDGEELESYVITRAGRVALRTAGEASDA